MIIIITISIIFNNELPASLALIDIYPLFIYIYFIIKYSGRDPMDNKLEKHIKEIADSLNIPAENAGLILQYFQGENETLESIIIRLSGESEYINFSNLRFQ